MNEHTVTLCQFCSENNGKYTCPRCNCMYCSLKCYRSERHEKCSEAFYKQCVTESLQGHVANEESKAQVIDILKRQYAQTLTDEYDKESGHIFNVNNEASAAANADLEIEEKELSDGLASLNVNSMKTEELWNCLSEIERKQFKCMIKSGDIARVIPDYKPWWKTKKNLISAVDETEILTDIPAVMENIRKLSDLTKISPSDCIQYNVINVLYSYAYVLVYFNGEIHENSIDAATAFLEICNNLRVNEMFSCLNHAIHSSIFRLYDKRMSFISNEHSANVIQDVKSIIEGMDSQHSLHYVLAALCDVLLLFKKYKKLTKKTNGAEKVNLNLVIKKIEFYLSWTYEYGSCLCDLLPSLEIEHLAAREDIYVQTKLTEKVDTMKKTILKAKSPLIEEVDE